MASCVILSSVAPSVVASMSLAQAPSSQQERGNIRRFSGLKPAYKLVPAPRVTYISNHKSVAGAGTKAPLTIVCESTTLSKVQEIIASQLSVDLSTVQPESKFADLGADSLDTVEIVMAIEEKFGVSISEESAEKISNVQQVADLIEKQNVAS